MTESQPPSEQFLHNSPLQSRWENFVACMEDLETTFEAFKFADKLLPIVSLEEELLPIASAEEALLPVECREESLPIDGYLLRKVERLARNSLLAAKNLHLQFIALQGNSLQEEIDLMEEELKKKSELIEEQERLIQRWRKEVTDQVGKHNTVAMFG